MAGVTLQIGAFGNRATSGETMQAWPAWVRTRTGRTVLARIRQVSGDHIVLTSEVFLPVEISCTLEVTVPLGSTSPAPQPDHYRWSGSVESVVYAVDGTHLILRITAMPADAEHALHRHGPSNERDIFLFKGST